MDLDFKCKQCGNPYELPERMPQTIVGCCNNVRCTSQKGKLSVKKSDRPVQNRMPLESADQINELSEGIEPLKEQVNDLDDIKKQKSRKFRGRCIKRLIGHENIVTCLEFLPSGELVSCSSDKTIKIWNIKGGKCVKTLKGHTRGVYSLVLLPSGELASGSVDETIKIWDLETGVDSHTLTGHYSPIMSLEILPTVGLASGSNDNTIEIWDLSTFRCIMTLTGHKDPIKSLQILHTGELASCSHDKLIKIWDLKTGECLMILGGHEDGVNSLLVLPSNDLVSGADDGTIKIWDVKNGECLKTITIGNGIKDNYVRSLVLSQDGKMIISCLASSQYKIWDVGNGKCIMTLQGDKMFSGSRVTKFLPTGELVSGGVAKIIKIWR